MTQKLIKKYASVTRVDLIDRSSSTAGVEWALHGTKTPFALFGCTHRHLCCFKTKLGLSLMTLTKVDGEKLTWEVPGLANP